VDTAFLFRLVVIAPVVFFSLTIHEFMHAWTAWKCGDDTALRAGRVTLNPLAHLDVIGTLCLFFAPIGWAKPVPVNPLNYNRPKRDEILVSGAGVAANLTVAILVSLFLRITLPMRLFSDSQVSHIILMMLLTAMMMNFGLFVFNLLPIFPLDGSHILRELLPAGAAIRFQEVSRYGIFILLAIVLANRNLQFDFIGYHGVHPMEAPIVLLMYVFAGPDLTSSFFMG
jgi:Zn-dependent protease